MTITMTMKMMFNPFNTGKIEKIFEMSIIPQTLNISNLRTTSAKSINLHTIRKLIKYSLEKVLVKTMFTLNVFQILLFERRFVLSIAQQGTGRERGNFVNFFRDKTLKSVSI